MENETPALLGGSPVRPEGPPDWPFPDPNVRAALQAAHDDGSWGKYLGPHVEQLEQLLAEFHDVPHVVTCASGTLAVEIALRAVGVEPGTEVILGGYDFEPSFLSIHNLGARPVLVDVSAGNACLDPAGLETAITPATKAILVSHLHGGVVSMSSLMAAATRHKVAVVEDAAQAVGATVEGRPAGSWGDVGILSFGGSKLVTAGRGGALLMGRLEIAQRARLALGRGIQQWAALSELQAAALVPQVRSLAIHTATRYERVRRLLDTIRDIPGLRPFGPDLQESRPAYYKLGFYLDDTAFGLSRDVFVKALRAEGIAFDPGFCALHVGRTAARYRAAGSLVNAKTAGRTVVGLHHPVLGLGLAEVDQVAAAIRKTYRNAARLR